MSVIKDRRGEKCYWPREGHDPVTHSNDRGNLFEGLSLGIQHSKRTYSYRDPEVFQLGVQKLPIVLEQ
jgi:hypothetical protein